MRRPLSPVDYAAEQVHRGSGLTQHRCQQCGARLLLADLISGRAVHERVGDSEQYRTRCRKCSDGS